MVCEWVLNDSWMDLQRCLNDSWLVPSMSFPFVLGSRFEC
jgi:hypothetical protein